MVTIIGDVHNRYDAYKQITDDCEYTVQIGDMGLDYQYLYYNLDPDKHKFFGGNHDNYDQYYAIKHSLGDFGPRVVNDIEFFFVRGAFSIDIMYRLSSNQDGKKEWWHQEELDYVQMRECEELYRQLKPNVVLSHSAPTKAMNDNFTRFAVMDKGFDYEFESKTSSFLQYLFDIHQPDLWIFGHFHKRIEDTIKGTKFICVPELGFVDLEKKNGKIYVAEEI